MREEGLTAGDPASERSLLIPNWSDTNAKLPHPAPLLG